MMVSFLTAQSYCHPNPCRNNGYCYEKGATFECSCEFGFKGPTCAGTFILYYTAKKMKFSIKDFFSKCDQTRRKLRIWSRFLNKSLTKNFIFCAVLVKTFFQLQNLILEKSIWLTHLSQTSMMKLFAKNLLIIFAKGFILDICLHAKYTLVCCLLTRILFPFYHSTVLLADSEMSSSNVLRFFQIYLSQISSSWSMNFMFTGPHYMIFFI